MLQNYKPVTRVNKQHIDQANYLRKIVDHIRLFSHALVYSSLYIVAQIQNSTYTSIGMDGC